MLTPWRDKVAAHRRGLVPGPGRRPRDRARAVRRRRPRRAAAGHVPAREEDIPTAGDPEKYPGVGRERRHYKEGVFVGYRWFDDERARSPPIPFGYGLSYTTFRYARAARCAARRATPRPSSSRSATPAAARASTVPQLYLGLPRRRATVEQPPRQLKGFRKLTLRPGQRARVRFRIDAARPLLLGHGRDGWQVAPRLLPGDGRPLVTADRAHRRGVLRRQHLRVAASSPKSPRYIFGRGDSTGGEVMAGARTAVACATFALVVTGGYAAGAGAQGEASGSTLARPEAPVVLQQNEPARHRARDERVAGTPPAFNLTSSRAAPGHRSVRPRRVPLDRGLGADPGPGGRARDDDAQPHLQRRLSRLLGPLLQPAHERCRARRWSST